jgi:uncharacterized protein YjiS (DUF1127 family)
MSASIFPSPSHAGAERLAGFWNIITAAWEGSAIVWRHVATHRGPAEMDARMLRDIGLTPKMVRAELTRAPWQIDAGLR